MGKNMIETRDAELYSGLVYNYLGVVFQVSVGLFETCPAESMPF